MGEVTELLHQARNEGGAALNAIYEMLYTDLRRIARSRLRGSEPLTLLDTTALVHESYLRFLKAGDIEVNDKAHFLSYAARVMRSIVIDLVRNRATEKRGGGAEVITLITVIAESAHVNDEDLIRINDALEMLAKIDPRLVQVVEMRYFAGLTQEEIADALQVSSRTVERDWEKARTILYGVLNESG